MPDLSLTTLTWINGALLVLYLPLGFMGWAFAAGALANREGDSRRQQSWCFFAALAPAGFILLVTLMSTWFPSPWGIRLAWVPLGVVALLLALGFGAAIVSGFLQGLRGDEEES